MKPLLLLRAAIVVLATSATAFGQAVRPDSIPYMSRVFHLDGFGIADNPQYSRDGKWLAFDAPSTGGGGRHIWVMPAKGGTPISLSPGDHDIRPMWTAAGDRLVFHTPEDGGAVMTVGIDPATGHPTGPIKRVTIDSLRALAFDVAPDGRSVAYLTPVGSNRFDLRVVPINGGPSKTLTTVEASGMAVRFDRAGGYIYLLLQRVEGTPKGPTRDVKRIAASGGIVTTVCTIRPGLMGVQVDPVAERIIVRDNDRAYVWTLAGDSLETIAWAGYHSISNFAFAPDASSLVATLGASHASIHLVPLDGAPVRALTDESGYPWPDSWTGNDILIEGPEHTLQALRASDGTRRTIPLDVRKANDGVPESIVDEDPFSDGVHYLVKVLDAQHDTSLFISNSRNGDARLVTRKLVGSRAFTGTGAVDSYSLTVGDEILYRSVKNGVAELHLLDVSGRDRIVQSFALPTKPEAFAFGPGRVAHAYYRGDTLLLDVTIGSEKPVHVLTRPGERLGEMVFKRDGSSLFAEVIGKSGGKSQDRGGFFSTANVRSLALPSRWVETEDCWHFTWLPDGAGVLAFCENATGNRTWVARLTAAGSATAQSVTQRESATFWDYTMSPDGKYVAVPAEKNSGADLWRIDLRGAAKP